MNLKDHIRSIKDYPKKGILFRDITTLIKNAEALISIDARGFVFGSAIALQASKPMIVARKPGKLPGEIIKKKYNLEYGENTLTVQKKSINKFNSFAIIDDLIATGGTADAAAKLVEISKGKVAGFIFVINLFDLNGSKGLVEKGYQVENLIEFPGH